MKILIIKIHSLILVALTLMLMLGGVPVPGTMPKCIQVYKQEVNNVQVLLLFAHIL